MSMIFLLAVLVVCPVILAAAAGIFRGKSLAGSVRVPVSLGPPLSIVLISGFLMWIAAQAGYGAYLQSRAGLSGQITEASFTAVDWAVLATIPPLAGFATLLAGDLIVGARALLFAIGVSLRKLPAGILYGLVASVIVLPLVYAVSIATSLIYDKVHFQHPGEHELLLAMKTSDWTIRVILIAAASVIAPLWEELLFRAHLQTLIGHVMTALSGRRLASVATIPATVPAEGGAPVLPDAQPDLKAPRDMVRTPRQAWLAILIASAIFAMVHPRWMWPPIFCLAIGLGYAYERTGNLWASITMHCLFNSISTAIYLRVH